MFCITFWWTDVNSQKRFKQQTTIYRLHDHRAEFYLGHVLDGRWWTWTWTLCKLHKTRSRDISLLSPDIWTP